MRTNIPTIASHFVTRSFRHSAVISEQSVSLHPSYQHCVCRTNLVKSLCWLSSTLLLHHRHGANHVLKQQHKDHYRKQSGTLSGNFVNNILNDSPDDSLHSKDTKQFWRYIAVPTPQGSHTQSCLHLLSVSEVWRTSCQKSRPLRHPNQMGSPAAYQKKN